MLYSTLSLSSAIKFQLIFEFRKDSTKKVRLTKSFISGVSWPRCSLPFGETGTRTWMGEEVEEVDRACVSEAVHDLIT